LAEEEQRQFLEEHVVPERRGMLGGRSIETSAGGRLQKTTFAATCDVCGHYPLDGFVTCFSCHARLCVDCSVKMNGIPYCRQHLMEILPLSRNSYKVLACIKSGIDDAAKICDITKMPKDDVKGALAFLVERKFISASGLFAFLERKITAEGSHALSVYKGVYGNEEDVREVEEQLAEDEEDGE
jgi:hypothetical protein